MCEPTTIALVIGGMAAASTAVGAYQQNKSANAQAKAMGLQAEAEQNALGLQMQQQGEAAVDDMSARVKAARAEAASFDAIANEYGGGNSVSRQAAEITFARDRDLATIQKNRNNALSQIGQESIGSTMRLNSGLASISRPTYLGTALTIAGAGASGYMAAGGGFGSKTSNNTQGPGLEGRPNRAGR